MEAVKRIEEFRLFEAHEIQVRAGQKTKANDKIAILLYQDARAAMRRLDERFGEYGWQREHKDVHGVTYCGVSLWDDSKNCWVTKWDAGEPSNTAPQKGEASDSFKRACVNWGIGRELYTAPRMYVPITTNTFGLSVQSIAYDDNRRITAITIVDAQGNIIYQKKEKSAPKRKETAQAPTPANHDDAVISGLQEMADRHQQANDEFTGILADIESIDTPEKLIAYMKSNLVQQSPYKEALIRAGHGYAQRKGWEKKKGE